MRLTHVRVGLALHRLDHAGADPVGGDGDGDGDGDGRDGDDGAGPLLLLHGLGERSPATVPAVVDDAWPGPVWALDFTGHGASDVPPGGGYTCEQLMGDVDAALASIGPATLLGRGLGAYVALLVAGARPADVRGVVLADGPGLDGGGPGPVSTHVLALPDGPATAPDPFALAELTRDPRPPDYATAFARQALQRSAAAAPLVVAARARPPWVAAVASEPGVVEVASVAEALVVIASGEPDPG